MAELSFFATIEDHRPLIELLITQYKAEFVLDGGVSSEPPIFKSVEQVINVIQNERYFARFFILSPLWSVEPLDVHKTNHNDGRIRFYVSQRYGGPAFDYCARRITINDNNEQQIIPSDFSDYPYYFSKIERGLIIRRPESMFKAFKDIKKLISKNARRSEIVGYNQIGSFVMTAAIKAHDEGVWLRVGDLRYVPKHPIRN